MIRNILYRVYDNFLMPSRMETYADLIQLSLKNGYLHLTLSEYFENLGNNKYGSNQLIFIHRHDIDTDPSTARLFFETEKKFQIKASYYFRKSTIDLKLMKEIHNYGSEVGYHFEELSDYCKLNGIKDKTTLSTHFSTIQENFTTNFLLIEKQLGFKIKSIASHGDFVNRKLGVPNHAFIDEALLKKLGIDFECYDPKLITSYSFISSDLGYPDFYRPSSPILAVNNRLPVVYLLTHPRHWRISIKANLKEDYKRFREGLMFH